MADPREHTLSEEEINNYSKELDELFQSLIPLIDTPSESSEKGEEHSL